MFGIKVPLYRLDSGQAEGVSEAFFGVTIECVLNADELGIEVSAEGRIKVSKAKESPE